MISLFNAVTSALLVTALFRMRFREWDRPKVLIIYFSVVLSLDLAVHLLFIPEGLLSPMLGAIMLCLSGVVFFVTDILIKMEKMEYGEGGDNNERETPTDR
tara:strand:+ start:231 stop:533 length:303 start_codon:yes stop_codon:yes gene_type:complete